jgi:hypothetical protein
MNERHKLENIKNKMKTKTTSKYVGNKTVYRKAIVLT